MNERLRVLTIDDSQTMLDMLAATLISAGFDVTQATNGQEGIDCLDRDGFDVVITDVNMPIMDGLSFIREVRDTGRHPGLPILILTTETSREKRDAGRAAGGTGWIVKPFDPDRLVQVVRKVCH